MYVRIDQPGKNGGIAKIVDLRAGRNLSGWNNRVNPFPVHENGGRPNSLRSDHSTGDESLQAHGVSRRPARK